MVTGHPKPATGYHLNAAVLRGALIRAEAGAQIIAARALLVNAEEEAARAFYERQDFEPSSIHPLQLFLPMKDIRATLRTRQSPRPDGDRPPDKTAESS